MAKVLTFSRTFPSYHLRAGEGTNFIQKVLVGLGVTGSIQEVGFDIENYDPKFHTVRAGERWKVGDKFSPRVWSGKPYASKQITIAPDVEIKKVFRIVSDGVLWYIDNQPAISDTIKKLAANDGLSYEEFLDWFKYKPFIGQIICWDENINY